MKNIQNIAIATIIVFFSVSCKKEGSLETKDVTKAKTEIAAKNLETANFTIDGMTCAIGCAKTIEGKLIETEGVQEAVVDFESKIATVSFDKTKQNEFSLPFLSFSFPLLSLLCTQCRALLHHRRLSAPRAFNQ